MDTDRFDAFTRSLRSRRAALGAALGTLAVLVGFPSPEEAGAHNPLPACGRLKKPKQRAACRRRARRHNRTCHPKPAATTCAGRCGTWPNNCGRAVLCPGCPTGKTCLSNGSCARFCSPGCPSGCGCFNPDLEGHTLCHPFGVVCELVPQACDSTAHCPVGYHCASAPCGPNGTPVNRCQPLCQS